jgi:hypothetical protein
MGARGSFNLMAAPTKRRSGESSVRPAAAASLSTTGVSRDTLVVLCSRGGSSAGN